MTAAVRDVCRTASCHAGACGKTCSPAPVKLAFPTRTNGTSGPNPGDGGIGGVTACGGGGDDTGGIGGGGGGAAPFEGATGFAVGIGRGSPPPTRTLIGGPMIVPALAPPIRTVPGVLLLASAAGA